MANTTTIIASIEDMNYAVQNFKYKVNGGVMDTGFEVRKRLIEELDKKSQKIKRKTPRMHELIHDKAVATITKNVSTKKRVSYVSVKTGSLTEGRLINFFVGSTEKIRIRKSDGKSTGMIPNLNPWTAVMPQIEGMLYHNIELKLQED